MIVAMVILFGTGIALLVVSVLIYRGNTNLIHDYHRGNVKDLPAYGRDFGKALAWLGVPLIAGGTLLLFGEDSAAARVAPIVTVVGFALAFIPIVRVQRRHNGGMFS